MDQEENELEYTTVLQGVNWNDDNLFMDHSWWDETSQFDDNPTKRWAGECYEIQFTARIPKAIIGNEELVNAFIVMMSDNFPGVKGFWVEP